MGWWRCHVLAAGVAIALLPGVARAQAAAAWNGRYTYALDAGKNAAGTPMIVTYALTLTRSSCRLSASGYQVDEIIRCTVKPSAPGIDIAFQSYGDGGTTDRYGNAVYAVGDLLFALERRGGALITRWKGYALADDRPHAPGVYFVR